MWNRILRGEIFNAPGYVVALLGFLIVLQLRALFQQFESGFRPFAHDPVRVAFSWDMFATRTERCLMEWDPPLESTPIGTLSGLKQLSLPFEWDLIYDSLEQYQYVGQMGCAFESKASNKIRVRIQCFAPEGEKIYREFYCS
ncbi:MAG: hypothetical protein ABIQ95_08160 [Bdellovibrionia bacterium]